MVGQIPRRMLVSGAGFNKTISRLAGGG